MDSEQFFLKWNNFESNLASGFADLLQKEAMVDVTIAAEGKIIQAHKIILSICSSYFRNMFQVNPCQHPIVVLKDVRYQELTDMLDFMYKGEANVRQEDLPSFLKLAETLKVKGLAVTQGELDESSIKKNSESQISTVTKNPSSFTREEPTHDYEDREAVARKKTKRCSSPLAYPEPRALPHSPNIKMEMEECDNNFMRTSVNTNGRNTVVKEERLSDSSMDSYGESQVANESWRVDKMAGRSTVDENLDTVPQGAVRQTRDYSFSETRCGNLQIVLRGYIFRKKRLPKGKPYWYCRFPNCGARGILLEDGNFRLSGPEHNHKVHQGKLRRQEELARLRDLALRVDSSGHELLKALGIKRHTKKNLDFIRLCRMRRRNKISGSLYSELKNDSNSKRGSKKRLLRLSGCTYRKHSVDPGDKNCEYWKCTAKNCKGMVKTDGDGNLTLLNAVHSHPVEAIQDQLNQEGQEPNNEPEEEIQVSQRRRSDRLSRKEERMKLFSQMAVQNSTSCPDSDSNLDKSMEETLDEEDCVTIDD